mmetsp:Transcript_10601/g.24962  ORF Transcript_10601/g.24962 Transcript_10601/m.24962 type:complete len:239 (-) Transcript_10601:608-1324(-)
MTSRVTRSITESGGVVAARVSSCASGSARASHRKGDQRQGHQHHAAHHGDGGDDGVAVVAVGGGEELCEGDVDHHARHEPEHDPVRDQVDLAPQHRVPEQRPDRLAHPAQRRPHERPQPRARRVVDWHRDTHALRNVVDGNRNGNRSAQRGVRHRADEGGEALREVVHRNRQPRQQPGGVELLDLGVTCLEGLGRRHAPQLELALAGATYDAVKALHSRVHPADGEGRKRVLDLKGHR